MCPTPMQPIIEQTNKRTRVSKVSQKSPLNNPKIVSHAEGCDAAKVGPELLNRKLQMVVMSLAVHEA